jgi:predicted transcriptional regulator
LGKKGGIVMNLGEILAINLKYYRKLYNLSQEKFSEVLGTTLPYLNQIENYKVDVKLSTVDKFTRNINKYDSKIRLSSENLLTYSKDHLTNFTRIDQRNKN